MVGKRSDYDAADWASKEAQESIQSSIVAFCFAIDAAATETAMSMSTMKNPAISKMSLTEMVEEAGEYVP